MNTQTASRPSGALRTLDLVLKVFSVLLILMSALALPLIALGLSGRATITLDGRLDAPFAVEFVDGSRVAVSGGVMSYENVEIGREHRDLARAPTVAATINVERGDLDSRVVVSAMALLWLAAAWIGLRSFRSIVGAALRGDWLADENPNRLRYLGGAILAVGVTGLTGQWLLGRTLDTTLPFVISIAGSSWLLMLVTGVGVLALAEPFAEAARLREFEASAI